MANEWRKLCSGKGLHVEGDDIVVNFGERTHRVNIEDDGDAYRLTSLVTKKGINDIIEDLSVRLWERNRSTQLVGFRLDARGRVVGESWAPKAGLSGDEFMMHVRHVAAECDRLEYLLTGEDELQ